MKEKREYQQKEQAKEKENLEAVAKRKSEAAEQFERRLSSSKDLADELKSLVSHLKDNTGSTAVYVGKVVQPIKAIKEGSNDTDHLDPGADKQILFKHASGDHSYLEDKVLKQDQGITYQELFNTPDEPPAEVTEENPEVPAKENLPKYIFRDEVVTESKMHYFSVPRLGSYLAIRLEYESCLFEEAYDAAV